MGLIRSGYTNLTPTSTDNELTNYLWPIVREIIKTAVENEQNLILGGCYIPYNWQKDFSDKYLKNIRCYYLVMIKNYIINHFNDIKLYSNVIEKRLDDNIELENIINDNETFYKRAVENNQQYFLIDDEYKVDIEL